MKKTFALSVLFFVGGLGVATTILMNPFGWAWVHPTQDRLLGLLMAEAEGTVDDTQLWMCPMHPHVLEEEPGLCPICEMTLVPVEGPTAAAQATATVPGERTIKYWRAPMDPTYISDQPGTSPMGMDLVPVYDDEVSDIPGLVQIDPGFVQRIGVQSVDAIRSDIPFTIRTVGTFTYDEGQIYAINTKYEGWIENAAVNYVGESVEPGQRLFDIFSPQLIAAQQEYLDAIEYLERLSNVEYPDIVERARSLVDSARQRLRYWDITDSQLEELEKLSEPRRTLPVFSPVAGVVVEKMGQALDGMLARPGMNLYKIVDLSTIWLEAEVYEDQIPWLRVGQRAVVEVSHRPGSSYAGTVRYIYPFVDRDTRTLRLSLEIQNPRGELRADMYANVTFDVPSARGVVTVPEEAVIRTGERNVVVIDLGDGTFQVREVDLGLNGNGLWEVREGLAEGARVVVSSQFLIDSESSFREAIRKLISERTTGEPSEPDTDD